MSSTAHCLPELDHAGPKSLLCQEVSRLAVDRYGKGLQAILLTGSMARGEGSFARGAEGWKALGDAEFFLVFFQGGRLPGSAPLSRLCQEIQESLGRQGLQISVGMSPVHPVYFQTLPRHIFSYELKTWGQVIWGDSAITSLIPEFPAAQLSLEDAWRLLNNRMIELLEVSSQLEAASTVLPPPVLYRTAKLYLDMATSFLVFQGAYEPSYRSRAAGLHRLLAGGESKIESPFLSLRQFAERVQFSTDLKLRGASDSQPGITFWTECVEQALCLWEWEFRKLQPLRRTWRGWAYLLRRCGWHRSWRQWPRWMKMSLAGSPRQHVYAVAAEALFSLPASLADSPSARLAGRGVAGLPLVRHSEATRSWQALAAEIAWNYHNFLEGTTA